MTQQHLPDNWDLEIFKIIQSAAESLNLETYVVGGYVRDILLGRTQKKDLDFVCVGSGILLAETVNNLLGNDAHLKVFKNFGTAMVKTPDYELEFVGARKESYQRGSRKPAIENGSLQDDQLRRDFTINALAISLNKNNYGQLVDPFKGIKDLHNKIIRTPIDPKTTFSDDPLRMLRAIRFANQLNFDIEPNTYQGLVKNAERIKIVSNERIVDELNKIIACKQPSYGFKLLENSGLLELILPELTALKGIEEKEGQRHKENFFHTLEVLDNISLHTENIWLRWAALLHDIGKAPTKRFHKTLGWTFHGHEFVGSKMTYQLFKRLRLPLNEKMKYVQKLVRLSSRPIAIVDDKVTDSAIRRLLFEAGDDINDLMLLCEADITTKNPKRYQRYHENFKYVRNKLVEVEERDRVRNFQPPVDGNEIMQRYRLKAGKEIGLLKQRIKDAILDGEIPNEYEAAIVLLDAKARELGVLE
ncbi:MAG: HD domain-containing protein [Flavobacteriaceae bacterium]|nr:HD domain-containing protein [Flavobacteriaceae bacterium]